MLDVRRQRVMTEEERELQRRWDRGHVAAVMTDLRRLLVDHDGLFDKLVDLRGIRLPDDVNHPRELWLTHLVDTSIQNIDLSFSHIDLAFARSRLRNVSFAQAVLDRVNLNKTILDDCVFRNAKLAVFLDDARVTRCDFTGALFRATRSDECGGRRTRFVDCQFDSAIFRRVQLRATRFEGCSFHNTQFIGSDLRGTRFDRGTPEQGQFDAACVLSTPSN